MSLYVDIAVRRGDFDLEVTFDVNDGETVALLGPNGAGKSTVIEAVIGVVPVERGTIRIDGRRFEHEPAERRPVGVAFQDVLLFPHLSVNENVAFPLRARGASRAAARDRADELLRRIAPRVPRAARPGALSGGERARVSLARALVSEPRALLLDEPLAAVDVVARIELRDVLRQVISSFAGACVLVAHDPTDAFALAERVVILEDGRVTQSGTTDHVRDAPATGYAAELTGVNHWRGRLLRGTDGLGRLTTEGGTLVAEWPTELRDEGADNVVATVRPAHVSIHLAPPEGSPQNVLAGHVVEITDRGARAIVRVASSPPVVAEITVASAQRLGLDRGAHVFAAFKATDVSLVVEGFDTGTLNS